jgi:arylsulfatase A-like enzyme
MGVSMLANSEAAAARKPNFVFILADDLGAFDLSCYGRRDYRTPRIDSLAREGMKFELSYANSSSCSPSRVGLISGRYQNRVKVGTGEGGGFPTAEIGYDPAWPSLPSTLKRAGYHTGLIGKWDLGLLPKFSPNKSGYDEFFGLMGGAIDYWSHDLGGLKSGGHRTDDLYENETPVKVEGYSTDLFTDRACDFISRNAQQPFLLSLHYNAPHWPWQSRTDHGQPRTVDFHYDGGSMAIYAQMMKALDDGLGKVLDALARHGLDRDTVIVFTSDNGGERFSYTWPLRGGKGDLWEGGIRVPLLVRWKGHIKAGGSTDQVAMSMDWLPTFAALAGAAIDPATPPDGIDLTKQLLGAPSVERTVFWKTPGDQMAALAFPWKYVRANGHEYLFNLREDSSENANYKLKQPKVFAQLKKASEDWLAQMLPSAAPLPAALLDALPALDPLPSGPPK